MRKAQFQYCGSIIRASYRCYPPTTRASVHTTYSQRPLLRERFHVSRKLIEPCRPCWFLATGSRETRRDIHCHVPIRKSGSAAFEEVIFPWAEVHKQGFHLIGAPLIGGARECVPQQPVAFACIGPW